jgi:type IV pilus assembly protein PilV
MTLIEVLIAAVVIGIGLLGIASMQVTALQGATNADYRSRATDLAASLGDRMRANLDGVVEAYYTNSDANDAVDCETLPDNVCAMRPQDTGTTGVDECSPQQMATFDLWEVRCRNGVNTSLPSGEMTTACIEEDGTVHENDCPASFPPLHVVVTISWQVEESETETVVTTILPGAP